MKAAPLLVIAAVVLSFSWATNESEGEPKAGSAGTAMASTVGPRLRRANDPPSPSVYQGRSAEWWATKTTHWKRAALKRGRTLAVHRRANRERIETGPHGVARAFLCIHGFEGSWTDPNPPFWGGLQMDSLFQRTYGGPFLAALGTADNWPPFIQVSVAMRAYYSGRGFGPWPNTRKQCGL